MSERGQRAVILFAHGARDVRWSQTLGLLTDTVQHKLPRAHVRPAYLEFQPPSLDEALTAALAAGCTRIDVLPVFWASGGHVANDLPPLLRAFRAAHPEVTVRLLPVLSELPGMIEFIAATVADS